MGLGRRRIGELVAVVGVVLGFIAVWVTRFEQLNDKYTDDGTFATALLIAVVIAGCALAASLLLGKVKLDLTAAVAGAIAFGLFLYLPSVVAFKYVDKFSWGAWLGICSGLIPIGAGAAHLWHKRSDAKAPGVTLATVGAAIGLLLIAIGIWLKVSNNLDLTYWKASASGHALGLLLLILVIASAILVVVAANARKAELADLALIVSAITVGVAIAQVVGNAFGSFGDVGTGAWLAFIGGLVLLLSLIAQRVVKLPELVAKK